MVKAHCVEPVSLCLNITASLMQGTNFSMPQNTNKNSSVYSFPEPKANQHLRLTLDEIVDQYKKKLIKATTLVYYAVKIYRQDGHKLQIKDINAFCQRLGINRSTFYKAINNLEEADIGFHSSLQAGISLWVEESPLGDNKSPLGDNESPLGDNESPLGDSESPLGDNESPLGDSESPLGDNESPLGDNKSPLGDNESPKPLSVNRSSASSDINQISNKSLSSLSQAEREEFENFVRKEYGKEIKNFAAFMRGDHFSKWWDKFVRATGRVDWEAYPDFPQWLEEIKENWAQFRFYGTDVLTFNERKQLVEYVEAKYLAEVAA